VGPGRATESIVLRVMTAADGNNARLAEGQAEAAGFDPATVAPHRDAFDWLVRFQVQGWTYYRIGQEYDSREHGDSITIYRDGVHRAAKSIGLRLRVAKPGRPRKG
jgi:hypothetical protein